MAHSLSKTTESAGFGRGVRARPLRRASRFGVMVVGAGRDGACIIELVASRSKDVLSAAYATLRRLGLRLVHTEVKVSETQIVQRLHVLEPDDSPLDPTRIRRALRALYATFSPDAALGGSPFDLSPVLP